MSEDLIKRSDAIETAYQLRHKPNDAEWTEWLKSFDAIPSPEPKTGEWVKREKIGLDENNIETCLYYWYECSECGHKPPCDPFRNEWYSSYCPNCGARMEVRKNDKR